MASGLAAVGGPVLRGFGSALSPEVLAAACPVKDARPIHGHEGSPGAPSLLSQLAPPGRSWDERGLQVGLNGAERLALGRSWSWRTAPCRPWAWEAAEDCWAMPCSGP